MFIFSSIDELNRQRPLDTPWDRLALALKRLQALPHNQAHSVGDSVVYVALESASLATLGDLEGGIISPEKSPVYLGKRRYRIVFMPLDGEIAISASPKKELAPIAPYSDLSDQELFSAQTDEAADWVTMKAGQVAVLSIAEAVAFKSTDGVLGIAFLTIEAEKFRRE